MTEKMNNTFGAMLTVTMMVLPLGLTGCASQPDLSRLNAQVDAAQTMARQAQDTANEALMKANTLQNAQNEAIRRADVAQQTANAAQRTANQAIRATNASNGG